MLPRGSQKNSGPRNRVRVRHSLSSDTPGCRRGVSIRWFPTPLRGFSSKGFGPRVPLRSTHGLRSYAATRLRGAVSSIGAMAGRSLYARCSRWQDEAVKQPVRAGYGFSRGLHDVSPEADAWQARCLPDIGRTECQVGQASLPGISWGLQPSTPSPTSRFGRTGDVRRKKSYTPLFQTLTSIYPCQAARKIRPLLLQCE